MSNQTNYGLGGIKFGVITIASAIMGWELVTAILLILSVIVIVIEDIL